METKPIKCLIEINTKNSVNNFSNRTFNKIPSTIENTPNTRKCKNSYSILKTPKDVFVVNNSNFNN